MPPRDRASATSPWRAATHTSREEDPGRAAVWPAPIAAILALVPRALWSGSIAFGLVSIPVGMYAAIDEHDLELHLVHEPDGARIGYEKVCKKEQRAVPDDEIVKAYEPRNGKLVCLTDEDFEAAHEEGYKAIDILDFVTQEEIDPIYFERSYYLGPRDGGQKAYALLVAAMERSGLVAIARYVFHDRQRLGCLRVRDGVLVLERLYFADEVRPVDDIAPGRTQRVERRELATALELIERFTRRFDPSRYEDEYREKLLAVIRRKQHGKEVHRPAAQEREPTADLLAALRESVEHAAQTRSGAARRRNGRGRASDLDGLTVAELSRRAARLGIRGRSRMSKRDLAGAIRKVERERS
jgi:DNA end-binding protein Ku